MHRLEDDKRPVRRRGVTRRRPLEAPADREWLAIDEIGSAWPAGLLELPRHYKLRQLGLAGATSAQRTTSASSSASAPVGTLHARPLSEFARRSEQQQHVHQAGVVSNEHHLVSFVGKSPDAGEQCFGPGCVEGDLDPHFWLAEGGKHSLQGLPCADCTGTDN